MGRSTTASAKRGRSGKAKGKTKPAKAKPSSVPKLIVLSQIAIARFFGVNRSTVDDWKNRGMPAATKGWELGEIARWLRAASGIDADDAIVSKADLEREKLRVEIDHRRLKMMQQAGQLVSRKAAKAALEQGCHVVKTRMEALVDEISSMLPTESRVDVTEAVRDKVRLALRELAEHAVVPER